ncbi:MAG: amidase [Ardenticatenaceae bacterium]|nr:amidase [Anaerolineales bacterium]MCB8921257.1 amidase [Ardenticatenaceae bacterium]MCB8990623.1 amidase [Ardenticatenaceae bacterium]MCB9004330.1 amidase [Ardenticatenaceae bacterium]
MNDMQPLLPLAHALRSGAQPLLAYLDELERRFAEREPIVQAFVPEDGRFHRLRREAQALLQHYPDPETRPPLFGVPVGVKDIFHVDSFVTRAGCKLPPDLFAGDEAPVVTRLKEKGALILGKTITTEFAFFAPGPTRNPHNPTHTPGGSSSGSAAAVAAGLSPLTLGSQTIGSVNRPAAYCGVVGYKPTYGRLPTDGILPLSPSVDTVGLFAADVSSLIALMPHLDAGWENDAAARPAVLGVPDGPYLAQAAPEGLAHFETVLARLQQAGFTIQRIPAMADFMEIDALHRDLVAAEAAQVHAGWYEQYANLYHPKTAALIQKGQTLSAERLRQGMNGRSAFRSVLHTLMDAHEIDLWLSPPAPGAAPAGLASTGDPVMNLPWTLAGLPTLTLPAGVSEAGLPMGLQLAARWGQDADLLAWGVQLETALETLL